MLVQRFEPQGRRFKISIIIIIIIIIMIIIIIIIIIIGAVRVKLSFGSPLTS